MTFLRNLPQKWPLPLPLNGHVGKTQNRNSVGQHDARVTAATTPHPELKGKVRWSNQSGQHSCDEVGPAEAEATGKGCLTSPGGWGASESSLD